ncbi:MAG: hypothetical protein ACREF7_03745, partial [Candidatus Saccharimonadales bacterium]
VMQWTNISNPAGTTDTQLSTSPHAVGNVMLLSIGISSSSVGVSTVTGGGVIATAKQNLQLFGTLMLKCLKQTFRTQKRST